MAARPPVGIPAPHGVPGQQADPAPMHQPGGNLLLQLLDESVTPFEHLHRVLPDEAWFTSNVSPSAPINAEIGAYQVPKGLHLWLFDYEFIVGVFSGLDAGDTREAEDGRFGTQLGFDLAVNGRRRSDLLFQLDPVPVSVNRQSFDPKVGTPQRVDAFTRATFQSFGSNTQAGTSLLPARRKRQGALSVPFVIVANQEERVSMVVVIFNPVTTPLPYIQASISGILVPVNLSIEYQQRMRPK